MKNNQSNNGGFFRFLLITLGIAAVMILAGFLFSSENDPVKRFFEKIPRLLSDIPWKIPITLGIIALLWIGIRGFKPGLKFFSSEKPDGKKGTEQSHFTPKSIITIGLALFFVVLVVVIWKRWSNKEPDPAYVLRTHEPRIPRYNEPVPTSANLEYQPMPVYDPQNGKYIMQKGVTYRIPVDESTRIMFDVINSGEKAEITFRHKKDTRIFFSFTTYNENGVFKDSAIKRSERWCPGTYHVTIKKKTAVHFYRKKA